MKTSKTKRTPQAEKPRKDGEWWHRPMSQSFDDCDHLILIGPDGIWAGFLNPEYAEKACRAVNCHDELVEAVEDAVEVIEMAADWADDPPGMDTLAGNLHRLVAKVKGTQ